MRKWTFHNIDFIAFPFYGGDDLGVTWSKERLKIKIWAPTAVEVLFRLYVSAEAGQPKKVLSLENSVSGTWEKELEGNYEGYLYTFQVRDKEGWLKECPDIGAKATGVNGLKGMIPNYRSIHQGGIGFRLNPLGCSLPLIAPAPAVRMNGDTIMTPCVLFG